MKPEAGDIIERVFANGIGMPHRRVADWRREHLEKGADWRYDREVILTAKGKAKFERAFQGESVEDPGVLRGVVGRYRWRNSRLIGLEDGTHVRVKDNANFRQGMPVKYRKESGGFVLVGNLPRSPGRY